MSRRYRCCRCGNASPHHHCPPRDDQLCFSVATQVSRPILRQDGMRSCSGERLLSATRGRTDIHDTPACIPLPSGGLQALLDPKLFAAASKDRLHAEMGIDANLHSLPQVSLRQVEDLARQHYANFHIIKPLLAADLGPELFMSEPEAEPAVAPGVPAPSTEAISAIVLGTDAASLASVAVPAEGPTKEPADMAVEAPAVVPPEAPTAVSTEAKPEAPTEVPAAAPPGAVPSETAAAAALFPTKPKTPSNAGKHVCARLRAAHAIQLLREMEIFQSQYWSKLNTRLIEKGINLEGAQTFISPAQPSSSTSSSNIAGGNSGTDCTRTITLDGTVIMLPIADDITELKLIHDKSYMESYVLQYRLILRQLQEQHRNQVLANMAANKPPASLVLEQQQAQQLYLHQQQQQLYVQQQLYLLQQQGQLQLHQQQAGEPQPDPAQLQQRQQQQLLYLQQQMQQMQQAQSQQPEAVQLTQQQHEQLVLFQQQLLRLYQQQQQRQQMLQMQQHAHSAAAAATNHVAAAATQAQQPAKEPSAETPA